MSDALISCVLYFLFKFFRKWCQIVANTNTDSDFATGNFHSVVSFCNVRKSSIHWLILLSFCSFLYSGVYYDVFKLSAGDVIVSQKGSNGEWK